MRRTSHQLAVSLLLVGIAGAFVAMFLERKSIQAAPMTPGFKPVGLVGCASSNCHGKPADGDLTLTSPESWKTSCGVWTSIDPHTSAYAVLDPERNAIARKMQAAFRKLEPNYSTLTDTRCLACHTNPSLANPTPEVAPPDFLVSLRAEGVSCEACHGNAQGWQGPHTSWMTPEKRKQGLADTGMPEINDWASRAAMCAGCHVGAPADTARGYPARDMNHDMIAAGHPRLVFEFSSHLARLPKHWYERDRSLSGFPARTPEESAKAWLLGQVATAEAQCELTADRARRGSAATVRTSQYTRLADPWPELAEWNCYACHHDLLPSSWRSKPQSVAGRKPGSPIWELPWPVEQMLPEGAAAATKSLRASVNPKEISDRTQELKKVLSSVREQISVGTLGEARQQSFALWNQTLAQPLPMRWDESYRMYLGLSSLEYSRQVWLRRKNQVDSAKEISTDLQSLAKTLNLPRHPVESELQPEQIRSTLRRVVQKLESEMQSVDR